MICLKALSYYFFNSSDLATGVKCIPPLILFILSCHTVCIAGDIPVSLKGSHKFSSGYNPEWALPQYDDSHWRTINIPGTWQSQGIKSENGMGWYRIRFSIKDISHDMEPGILLGRIGDADEVFLNGAKIGGEGVVGERFVEATSVERLYKIPQSLLVSGENLLAVRVMNTYLKGGIFESIIVIGDYNELLIEKMKRGNPIKISNSR